MATAKKPVSKSKVVSGSTKKSVKNLTLRKALFGLMGILAFSVICGVVYSQWQDSNLSAKAAGYPQIENLKPSKVQGTLDVSSMVNTACSTKIPNGKKITAHFLRLKKINNLGTYISSLDKNGQVVKAVLGSDWNKYNVSRATLKILDKQQVKSVRIVIHKGGDVYKSYTIPVSNIASPC